jgi:hypothetical protein
MKRLALIVSVAFVFGCTRKSMIAPQNPGDLVQTGTSLQCTKSVMNDIVLAGEPGDRVMYRDFAGRQRMRHILTEAQEDGRTLLLIIEQGRDNLTLPQIVFRRSFAPYETNELNDLVQSVHTPQIDSLLMRAEAAHALTRTNNPIWMIDHQWTAKDEDDYANWIAANAKADMLAGGGVDVDCADFAITLRWIYAHDHHLPAAQTLAGSGELFGSWESTTAWDALPANDDWRKDERFKAALRYVLGATFTHSLYKDLYPVTIDNANVTPGTIFLSLRTESGHTQTIYNVGTGGACDDTKFCISTIWGNEPASEQGFITELVPTRMDQADGGFMKHRWPEKGAAGWALRDPTQMSGYSLEQFTWDDAQYLEQISARLGLWANAEERFEMEADAIANTLTDRLRVTERGYFLCSLVPCAPGDINDVAWSTPGRDSRLKKSLKSFQADGAKIDPNSYAINELQNRYSAPFFTGAPFTTWQVLHDSTGDSFSPDPKADFFARWGIASPSLGAKLQALAQILGDNWQYREILVSQAHSLCFPNNESKPVCDACDPKVKALATDRLDQAFRLAQQMFTGLFNQADSQIQQSLTDELKQFATGEQCSGQSACTLYDYVLGDPTRWQKMSSDPTAPPSSRYGF